MSTKGALVNEALSKLRISGLTVTPTPELTAQALKVMENMMAELFERQMCMGYVFEDDPDTDTQTGVKRGFDNMIITNVAMRLAPNYGKEMPPTLAFDAMQSMSNCQGVLLLETVQQTSYPTRMPLGSGNEKIAAQQIHYYEPTAVVSENCDVQNLILGDVNDYIEYYQAYLAGENITSYDIEATNGLTIVSDSNTDERVFYRIKASSTSETGSTQEVKIVITTNTSRILTRTIVFKLEAIT